MGWAASILGVEVPTPSAVAVRLVGFDSYLVGLLWTQSVTAGVLLLELCVELDRRSVRAQRKYLAGDQAPAAGRLQPRVSRAVLAVQVMAMERLVFIIQVTRD